jgi:hypothetical protein
MDRRGYLHTLTSLPPGKEPTVHIQQLVGRHHSQSGQERLPSHPGQFTPIHIQQLAGGHHSQSGHFEEEEEKIFSPWQASHPRSSSQEPSHYNKHTILASSSTGNVMNNQSNLVNFKPIKFNHTAYLWHFLME